MAGTGRKVWAADEILAADDLQNYIQDQVVFVYANASARSSGILSPTEGMISYLADSNTLSMFNGAAWVDVLPNVGTAGTYTKVTTDSKGRVSAGTTLSASDIPSLDASKITTGTLTAARIPNLDASKITTGAFDADRIPNLDASKITTGAFDADRIPSLDASKITTGTLTAARIPNLDGSKITTGAISNLNSLSTDIAAGTGFVTTNILNIKNTAGVNQAQIASTGAAAFKNTTITGTLNVTSAAAVTGTLYSAATYNQTNTGRAVYVAADGLMGVGSSSSRFKENIVDAPLDIEAIRKIALKHFNYKKSFSNDQSVQLGVIAEDLVELGLTDFVFFGKDGKPDGVAYDRLSLAVLALVQVQADAFDALEARVKMLESK